jgi:predicted Zn-dependent protease
VAAPSWCRDDNQAGASLRKRWRSLTTGYGREHELESDRLGAHMGEDGPPPMIDVVGVLKTRTVRRRMAKRDSRQPRTYHGTFITPAMTPVSQVIGEANHTPSPFRSKRAQRISAENCGRVFTQPDQGMIRGNALLHEKLGLAIQFPPGWRVQNRPDRVMATNPKGDALVELQQGPKNARPLETLQKGIKLDAGARYDSGSLSGYPAAFAAGAQQGKPVVVAAVVFNGTQYLIAGMAKDKPTYDRERSTLRAAINSFRASPRPSGRPQCAAGHGAARRDDGKSGAAVAAGADASQLRLMNALYPAASPNRSQFLKIVR